MTQEMFDFNRACDWLTRTLGDNGEYVRRLGLDLAAAAKQQGRKEMMQ